MEYVRHAGRETAYRIVNDGNGLVVLYVHGSGGSHRVWARQYQSSDQTTAALDLTGTGPTLPVFGGLREWLDTDFDRAIEFLHTRDRLFHDVGQTLLDRSRAEMRSAGQAITQRDFLTCHRFDVADRISAIDVPTLALCGEHDQLTPRELHERLAQVIPAGEFSVVPDAAHLPMLEQPAAFNEAVAGFLDARLSD